MMSKEEQLDRLIGSKLRGFNKPKFYIEPSADFAGRVMSKINLMNRRERWAGYLTAVVLSMTPLAMREIWMFVRHDYFSVSSLPLGHFIVVVYRFLLSPAALYILLALGVLAFLLRANKLRHNFDSSFIKIA